MASLDVRRQAHALHRAGYEHTWIASYFAVSVRTVERWTRGEPPQDASSRRASMWQDRAACANAPDPNLWCGGVAATIAAKRVCAGCPVRQDCLAWARDRQITTGVWGGMSARQRSRLGHGPT